jgi:hypothetical protein
LIGLVASLIVFFKTKDKKLRFLLFAFCFLLFASLFIMTSTSQFLWTKVVILQNFQFPWRFLSLTTFIAAVMGGISISQLLNMFGQKTCLPAGTAESKKQVSKIKDLRPMIFAHCPMFTTALLIVFCFLLIVSTSYMWQPKDYQIKDESFYTGIYQSTTDTGESSPIWTTRFMEQTPKAVIEVISGEATVRQIRRTTTVHQYQVNAKIRAELLENTIYFPGWEVLVDGKKTDIEFQSGIHRGIMTFWVEKGEHQVTVVFRDTKLRKISNGITVVSGIVLILGSFIAHFLWKRKK